MKTLIVYRVSYGKESTPEKDREYWMGRGGPVGNKEDWKDIANKLGYDDIKYIEKEREE